MRIPFEQLQNEFLRVVSSLGFTGEKARIIATTFAENSRDGVYSHGLNRFPAFVRDVKEGFIDANAEPVQDEQQNLLERWDGKMGSGILNARFCMDRAIQLAKTHGIGCVAIRNTNHWLRGGTYGWQAANAGCIGINFTNTIANMPPWGGIDPRLGNNPLVIAVPHSNGHIVLDMAMTQYAYGKLTDYRLKGKTLPFAGGYDRAGHLTTDPAEILQSKRALPVGLWKGSGLSLVLDVLATVFSAGRSTAKITAAGREYGVSQVFICVHQPESAMADNLIDEILEYTKTSSAGSDQTVTYPGENMIRIRKENIELGIPLDEGLWKQVCEM